MTFFFASVEDELRVLALVDHDGLLAGGELGRFHRGLVVGAHGVSPRGEVVEVVGCSLVWTLVSCRGRKRVGDFGKFSKFIKFI